jgi:hypothetical protein
VDFLSDFSLAVPIGSKAAVGFPRATVWQATACNQPGDLPRSRFFALTVAGDWKNKGFIRPDTWYFRGDWPLRRNYLRSSSVSREGV